MTINLDLPPDLEARLLAEAKEQGLGVDEIVKRYLYRLQSSAPQKRLSAEEIDREFESGRRPHPEGNSAALRRSDEPGEHLHS